MFLHHLGQNFNLGPGLLVPSYFGLGQAERPLCLGQRPLDAPTGLDGRATVHGPSGHGADRIFRRKEGEKSMGWSLDDRWTKRHIPRNPRLGTQNAFVSVISWEWDVKL